MGHSLGDIDSVVLCRGVGSTVACWTHTLLLVSAFVQAGQSRGESGKGDGSDSRDSHYADVCESEGKVQE